MRLTYLAHASLLVEAGGVRLVTDPWLDGPTYLSAWWHFPEPCLHGATLGNIDYVYLTHEHVDHFHEPTLRALPRSTPILIGRYFSRRFIQKLQTLGFHDIRELPHGEAIPLGTQDLTVTSYQYRADDTALVLRDREATVLDLNDCLIRGSSLEHLLGAHPRIDLLAASFANAEAYPIVYDFEDPNERSDWDSDVIFDTFLDRVRQVGARSFVPFASMFCFLADDLFHINDAIISPSGLIARARAGEVASSALPMNPGDRWTADRGHEVINPIDWRDKPRILGQYRDRWAERIAAIAAAETVPTSHHALGERFDAFFRAFTARIPAVLRRKLTLAMRVDIESPVHEGTASSGQRPLVRWLRWHRGKLDQTPPRSDDAWDVRLVTQAWPLWRVLAGHDTWQTFGVSCRFRVGLRAGMREHEILFWFLLYLDDMGYLEPQNFLHPRGLEVLYRRRRELGEYGHALLNGSFIRRSLRGKFLAD